MPAQGHLMHLVRRTLNGNVRRGSRCEYGPIGNLRTELTNLDWMQGHFLDVIVFDFKVLLSSTVSQYGEKCDVTNAAGNELSLYVIAQIPFHVFARKWLRWEDEQ